MAYSKKGYRKYKKYYKRYSKKNALSKNNIFGRKNAKSQAYQIYKLNKKINAIEYKTKPEIYTSIGSFFNQTFTGLKSYHTRTALYEDVILQNYEMKGTILRPQNITIYGELSTVNFMNESSKLQYPLTGYARIIVCRLKVGNQGRLPQQITRSINTDLGYDDNGIINGPLVRGIAGELKIIKDKVVKVNDSNPAKMFRIKIKNPGTYKKTAHSTETEPYYQNEYMIYVSYYCPTRFLDGVTPIAPVHHLDIGYKIAFVDEN